MNVQFSKTGRHSPLEPLVFLFKQALKEITHSSYWVVTSDWRSWWRIIYKETNNSLLDLYEDNLSVTNKEDVPLQD